MVRSKSVRAEAVVVEIIQYYFQLNSTEQVFISHLIYALYKNLDILA